MTLYPDDISQRVRRLEQITDRLFTAINTQPSQVQIGATGGPRIVMAIGTDGLPEIRCYPGSGDEYARIVAGGSDAGIEITGIGNASGQRYSLLMDLESCKIFFIDGATGTQIEGTVLQATSAEGLVGFVGTSSSDQNYFFYDAISTTHVGSWADGSASAYWGLLTGSGSTSGTFATLTYPVTMASTMNPIIGMQGSSANFSWCITANSTTGFTVSRSTSGSMDLYYWVFRT